MRKLPHFLYKRIMVYGQWEDDIKDEEIKSKQEDPFFLFLLLYLTFQFSNRDLQPFFLRRSSSVGG